MSKHFSNTHQVQRIKLTISNIAYFEYVEVDEYNNDLLTGAPEKSKFSSVETLRTLDGTIMEKKDKSYDTWSPTSKHGTCQ